MRSSCYPRSPKSAFPKNHALFFACEPTRRGCTQRAETTREVPHNTMQHITIKSNALLEGLQTVIGNNKIGWSVDNHRAIVNHVLAGLTSDDGSAVQLDDHTKNVILMACCPTTELKLQVISQALEAAEYQLEADTQNTLGLLSDAAGFSNFLVKNNNPKTGKPFITKESRSKKANTFKKLLEAPVPSHGTAKSEEAV